MRTRRVIAIQEAQVDLNELVFDASGNLRPHAAEKEVDVDLETGEIRVEKVWIGQKKIKKLVEQSRYLWVFCPLGR